MLQHIPFKFKWFFIANATLFAVSADVVESEDLGAQLCNGSVVHHLEDQNLDTIPTPIISRAGFAITPYGNNSLRIAFRGKNRDVFVAQEYGDIRLLAETESGLIAVVGDERSYLLDVGFEGGNVVTNLEEMPALYSQRCGWVSQFFASCQRQSGSYSRSLKAILISGYDEFGSFRSYVYGLKRSVVDLTARHLWYGGDLPPDYVLLYGPNEHRFVMNRQGFELACLPRH